MKHQISTKNGQFVCRLCKWTWKAKPISICPGVPRYEWGEWLPNLKTKTQLRQMKLKPGLEPRGAYYRTSRVGKSDQFMWLYDEAEAVPSSQWVVSIPCTSQVEMDYLKSIIPAEELAANIRYYLKVIELAKEHGLPVSEVLLLTQRLKSSKRMYYKLKIGNCKQCGIRFAGTSSPELNCCSHRCSTTWIQYNVPKTKIACVNCGEKFTPRTRTQKKFCKPECRQDFYVRAVQVTKSCEQCGIEFSYIRNGRSRKFCSAACNEKTCRIKNAKSFRCKHCGKEFSAYVRPGMTRDFCSNVCVKNSQKLQRELVADS